MGKQAFTAESATHLASRSLRKTQWSCRTGIPWTCPPHTSTARRSRRSPCYGIEPLAAGRLGTRHHQRMSFVGWGCTTRGVSACIAPENTRSVAHHLIPSSPRRCLLPMAQRKHLHVLKQHGIAWLPSPAVRRCQGSGYREASDHHSCDEPRRGHCSHRRQQYASTLLTLRRCLFGRALGVVLASQPPKCETKSETKSVWACCTECRVYHRHVELRNRRKRESWTQEHRSNTNELV